MNKGKKGIKMSSKVLSNITIKTIVVDNLEVMFRGNIPLGSDYLVNKTFRFNSHCYIEFLPTGSRMFAVMANLYLYDRCVGELKFSPRKAFFDGDLINFKVDNVLLYGNEYITYIDYLVEFLKFDFLYISHMDIAVDNIGTKIHKFVADYYYKAYLNKSFFETYATRHKGKVLFKNITVNTTLYWGSKTADKYIKIYNKSLDLLDHSIDKASYANQFWKINGMDYLNNTVERIELTLRQCHSKLIDYKQLDNPEYLASIMRTHCENFFQFEKKYSNHNKTYFKDVTPITFSEYNTIKLDKYRPEKQHTLKSEHTTIKTLYMQYLEALFIASDSGVKNGAIKVPDQLIDYPAILNTINILLAKYPSAKQYFQDKKKGFEKEFKKVNDLYNNRTNVEKLVATVDLNEYILFETPDYSDIEYNKPYFQNLKPDEWANLRILDNRTSTLQKSLDTCHLRELEKDCDSLKKINKVAKTKADKNFKQSIILRNLNKL